MGFGFTRRRPGELPAEVTGFVGRETELALIGRMLTDARLVTVIGPGGVGKTRVALRAAERCAARYADGVALVELSGLRDAELLPNTVATALGLPEQDARPQLDVLLDYLTHRQLLLVLDTCEHLVDACAMLSDVLLHEAPGVTVLATSRQPLDVPGEHTCPIPPLPVPGDAVVLFEQRAAAAVPDFRITDANRKQVIALCQRLDGIPLAIELATVRLRAVPIEQLVERLEHRFRLLTGGRRTALPRHQTLRTAIGWSHELCTPQERLLWARLSVFAGPFDVSAAENVCAGGELPRPDVLERLIDLVDKSLVLRIDDPEKDGGTRYRLLDTIREYGAEWLAKTGEHPGEEEREVRQRHLAHYSALAAEFHENLFGDRQLVLFRAMQQDHLNLQAALSHALDDAEDVPKGAETVNRLWGYWQCAVLLTEGRLWLNKVVDLSAPDSPAHGWAQIGYGYLCIAQGDPGAALPRLEETVRLAEALGDPLMRARATLFLGLSMTLLGRHEEATEVSRRAREQLTALDDRTGLILTDAQEGFLHALGGDPDVAVDRAEQGLARLRNGSGPEGVCGERWMQGYLQFFRGLALWRRGDLQGSAACCRSAVQLKYDIGDSLGLAFAFEVLGWLAVEQRRFRRAAWLLCAAEQLWEKVGGRLAGVAVLEEYHRTAEKAVREELGKELVARLRRQSGRRPLEVVVAHVLDDAEELPQVTAQRQPTDAAGSVAAADTLTRREREVAALVTEGMSNREIAERLVISKRTADAHVEHILAKLGLTSRTEIAALVED